MATANPTLLTLNVAGLDSTTITVLSREWGAELAIDMRPNASDASVEHLRRRLQWGGRIESHRSLPGLHAWGDDPTMVNRLAATIRKYGRVLLVCGCATGCALPDLARRMKTAIPDLAVGSLNDAISPSTYDLPRADMAPEAVDAHLATVARLRSAEHDPSLIARREEAVAQMSKSKRYKITTINGNLRRRSATGYFSGRTGNTLFLEDANGRMNRMPVDRIVFIEQQEDEPVAVAA